MHVAIIIICTSVHFAFCSQMMDHRMVANGSVCSGSDGIDFPIARLGSVTPLVCSCEISHVCDRIVFVDMTWV